MEGPTPHLEYTRLIAEYVVGLHFSSLPKSVVNQTKIVLLDTLGSILAASSSEFVASRVIQRFVREAGGAPQASVAGLSERVPAPNAAFANGTMADNVEMDDSHPRTGAHIAAAVIPAALALAEWQGCQGQQLIEAIVAAYDVESRAILAANASSMYARGFHPSSVFGGFGAATAAAKLLELDVTGTINSLGLAGCQASGLMAWETDPTQMPKSLQLGIPARNGVTAALLAQAGFAGPPAIFEGRYNALNAFSDKATNAPLIDELGERYEIALTGLKLYPVCRFLHATLDAFFEIQRKERPSQGSIEEIIVHMPDAGVAIIDNNELRSHNAQYVLSIAAAYGEFRITDLFSDKRNDPTIASMMGRVHVLGDPQLNVDAAGRFSEPTVVEIHVKGGQVYTARADAASGDPEKALSWRDVVDKFDRLAAPVVGTERATQIKTLVEQLEALDNTSRLGVLIQA